MAAPLNILLVVEEFMTRRMLKTKVLALGHNVVFETDNANDAVSALDHTHIDLAIICINLRAGQQEGIWLGEYIRFNANIPFVYLTNNETADMKAPALNAHPHAYLVKPFSDLSLRTTIIIAVQQHASTQDSKTG